MTDEGVPNSAFDWLSQLGFLGFELALQITFGAETVCCLEGIVTAGHLRDFAS